MILVNLLYGVCLLLIGATMPRPHGLIIICLTVIAILVLVGAWSGVVHGGLTR